MTELYYNVTNDGIGLPGLLTYTNNLVDGWLVNLFLVMIWIVLTFVGAKSEWKMSSVVSTSFFVTFVTAMVLSVVVVINPILMWILGIGTAIGTFWMMIERKKTS